jgi:hypothetical protein
MIAFICKSWYHKYKNYLIIRFTSFYGFIGSIVQFLPFCKVAILKVASYKKIHPKNYIISAENQQNSK